MKLDEALDVVAEALSKDLHYMDMERRMLDAIKKQQGIEDLYFYAGGNWFYCGTENPRKTYWIISHPNIDNDTPTNEILCRLTSLMHGKWSQVCYDGEKFESLDDLKRYHLTKKLAGIK